MAVVNSDSKVKNRKYPKLGASKLRFLLIFVIPTFLLYVFINIIPMIESIYVSFFEWSGYTPDMEFLGLQNYINVLTDIAFLKAAVNDFTIVLFKEIIICSLTVLFAISLTRLKFKKPEKLFFRFVFYIPNVLSSIVFTSLWLYIFNPGIGLLDAGLRQIGLEEWIPQNGWMVDYTLPAIIWVASWCGVGSFMIILISAINNISNDLYEAAAMDGAGQWRQLWNITIPAVRPQMRYVMVSILCSSLAANMNIVLPMTNGGPDNKSMVMGLYVYQYGLNGAADVGYANAAAVCLMIISFTLSFLFNVVLIRKEDD